MEVNGHPISDERIALDFPEYVRLLAKRLRQGADSYGDGSFHRPSHELCGELAQEALDISGWGFVLWCRISEMERKLKEIEAQSSKASR